MPLTLLVGPANAGKVALLLERYLALIQRDPVLIVPNRSDVEAVERELLRQSPALFGGTIGTFDDLFERLARGNGGHREVLTEAQRRLVLRRVVDSTSLQGLGASARFPGFAEALGITIAELESGFVEAQELEGELQDLYLGYRRELDRLGLWDRELERRYAADRVAGELAAWDGRPVLAYGFEDLTGAQWALLESLAGRSEVTVSLPYEPGRAAFASLERTAGDLAALASGRIEELPPAYGEFAEPALAHLERTLFGASRASPPPIDGAIRFLEGAGMRGVLELVARDILELLREGVPAEEIGVVCPSLERFGSPIETAFTTLSVPFALEGRLGLARTPLGFALLSLLRFAWLDGERRDLYAFLRSPYSGLSRGHADYLEGRLRGRAVADAARVEEETVRLRGRPIPFLDDLRATGPATGAVRALVRSLLKAAHGLDAPPIGATPELDLRVYEAVGDVLAELERWKVLGGELRRDDVVAALERATVRLARAGTPGRVAIVDLLRARTRRFQAVFVLGLEEGTFPRRPPVSPFLDDDARRELEAGSPRGRLSRSDPLARERYLFYTACTRPSRRLYLVREAASDEGAPREASPFWHEARACFAPAEVERATTRRRLSALTWPLEAAPSERERLRALAALSVDDAGSAAALARANGWDRQLERARTAFDRPTRLAGSAVLEELRRRQTFAVTELETFATCSSMWLFDRLVDPKTIDPQVDARLRGQIIHTTLYRFFSGLPKRLDSDRVESGQLSEALVFLRECLDDALAGQVRLDLDELDRRELEHGVWRDLEQFVRQEAALELPLVPRRFEVLFGSERAAPELQRGLELGGFSVSGKIDRIDVDPFSARGIVQDYKSGKTAHSASRIEEEVKLQIPLYMLVLRDLIGIEPLGGLYRALSGERHARGLLRAGAREDGVPGFFSNDYRDEEEFWGQVERAAEHARTFVGRIRSGDVKHDPLGGFPCPSWCDRWSMCRVRRA
ncbi:MAG: PD-(D/E)XK nuclease family protein [Actinobacteria bacterium]|nr:PD-(D/E)XK nuclease family protein [Actinomycetota bacterium]